MDRKYIKSILSNTNMIHKVSKYKTKYSHTLNEFYFFRIFIESFNTFGIDMVVEREISSYTEDEIIYDRAIIFSKGLNDFLKIKIDNESLSKNIREYNASVENIGFFESTMKLIDIFVELL